jgi:hypothetical protein
MTYLTFLIICQLKPLYNNHSHNHRKYEWLSSINIKDFPVSIRQISEISSLKGTYDEFNSFNLHMLEAHIKKQIYVLNKTLIGFKQKIYLYTYHMNRHMGHDSLRRVGVISVWDMIVLQVSMILPLWLGMICVVTCVEENSLCLARNWKFSLGMNPFPLSLWVVPLVHWK